MTLSDKKKIARTQKSSGGSLASRVGKLEDLIEEIKEALEPSEMKIVFWAPGQPEPDPDTLPKNTFIVRFVSERESEEIDPADREKMKADFDARMAERAAEQALAQPEEPEPAPAWAGAHAHYGEQVTHEGYGVQWGKLAPIHQRFKERKNICEGMQYLSRKGII